MRQTQNKRLIEDVKEYAENVRRTTAVTVEETDAQKASRIKSLCKDPKKFQEYYFPDLKETPDYIIRAAKKVLANPTFFGWWMMFRGARKSTWLNIILPLMFMARGEMKFMVLIAQNAKASLRFLGSLQAQLENNQRYIHDFGEQMCLGDWASGEFSTAQGVQFVGLGMQMSTRGLNKSLERPDYIVATDLDSDEMSRNPSRVEDTYTWLTGSVLGTFETGGDRRRFVFDNNYFSKTSLGHLLMIRSKRLEIIRVDILDKDGKPAAPFITEAYIEELKDRGYGAFMREYMNTPITEGKTFKAEWIRWKPALKWREYEVLVTYTDPSFKSHSNADFKATVLMGKIGKEYHILKAFCRQTTSGVMIQWLYDLAEFFKKRDIICYHYIESSFNQDSIMQEFDEYGEKIGWWLDIVGDDTRKSNKQERIEAVSVKWETGRVYYNSNEKSDPDMLIGIEQTTAFEKGSSAHDDFPDCCEGGIAKIEKLALNSFNANKRSQMSMGRRDKGKYSH